MKAASRALAAGSFLAALVLAFVAVFLAEHGPAIRWGALLLGAWGSAGWRLCLTALFLGPAAGLGITMWVDRETFGLGLGRAATLAVLLSLLSAALLVAVSALRWGICGVPGVPGAAACLERLPAQPLDVATLAATGAGGVLLAAAAGLAITGWRGWTGTAR